jgi:hypothetical protein
MPLHGLPAGSSVKRPHQRNGAPRRSRGLPLMECTGRSALNFRQRYPCGVK